MKIVHITSEMGWRGGERQLFYLIEILLNSHIDNVLICPHNSQIEKRLEKSFKNSIQIFHLNANRPYNPRYWKKLKKIVQNIQDPILHIHTPAAHTLAYLSNLPSSIPQILHRRTIFRIKRNWLTRKKYLSSRIKNIICISNAIKKYTDEQLQQENKTITIHDGIDVTRFITDRSKAQKKLFTMIGVEANAQIVGNISALTPEKGYDTFLSVAERLIMMHPQIQFVICGQGDLENEIRGRITGRSLQKHIHLIGFQDNIMDILPGFDILFMPSRLEGLGTAILDAFLAEIPVISTNTGGIPELIIHEKTGLLYEVNDIDGMIDGIISLLNNPYEKQSIIKNAAKHLLHFSKENMALNTLNLYRNLTQ